MVRSPSTRVACIFCDRYVKRVSLKKHIQHTHATAKRPGVSPPRYQAEAVRNDSDVDSESFVPTAGNTGKFPFLMISEPDSEGECWEMMDDVHKSWDTSRGRDDETTADDSETGQVFPTLPVPLPGSVPTPDVESRLMEEDTLPCCTDVYPGHRKTLCALE